MKLTYRGIAYEPKTAPSVAPISDLRYRGVAYRQKQAIKAENFNAVLTYRGVKYTLNPTISPATEVAPALAVTALPIEEQVRRLNMKHHQAVKNRQQAMLTRSAAEIGFNDGAANYWTRIQGKIQPSFWSYDRSHAALS